MYISLHVKYPLFLSDFNKKNFNFLTRFFEKYSYTKFHEIRLVGAKLFHADAQTDMTKLTVTFHNFVITIKIHQWN